MTSQDPHKLWTISFLAFPMTEFSETVSKRSIFCLRTPRPFKGFPQIPILSSNFAFCDGIARTFLVGAPLGANFVIVELLGCPGRPWAPWARLDCLGSPGLSCGSRAPPGLLGSPGVSWGSWALLGSPGPLGSPGVAGLCRSGSRVLTQNHHFYVAKSKLFLGIRSGA